MSLPKSLPERPITLLVAALGGEGGGVLADWIIAAATAQDYPVQSTSIPGVAQRTGATTYYLEIYPAKTSELGGKRPVMTLTPAPGYVDVMVASELLEAGRAMQNGYVAEHTTLIASTHRVYTVAEKMQMGDGRFDTDLVIKAAQAIAKRAILFDMEAQTKAAGTVISAVMFGALAGSGALPLTKSDCEAAIRAGGRGAEASLRGFELGYAQASGANRVVTTEEKKRLRGQPNALARSVTERVRATFPPETHAILEEGVARATDFQNRAYANRYLDRLEPIARLDREQGGGATGFKLTSETGRFLALWMCYEDVIRVGDLKSRKSRFERVREEVQAKPHEPVHVIEFLKPGVDEFTAVLPGWLAHPIRRFAERQGLVDKLNIGMHIKTTSVAGFLMLRSLAWLRPLRPLTSRWHEEQALIERWLASIAQAAANRKGGDLQLALEIALCGRLIKGYGETHRRGKGNFLRILDTLVDGDAVRDDRARAEAVRKAREAALADPEGRSLEGSLAVHGIAPLPPKPKPVQFMRRPKQNGRKAA
jgi:indolepyruvate ferredoxin oxidoreductase beta subunit